MRLAPVLLAFAVFISPLTSAVMPTSAVAQQAPATPPCTGNLNIIRISEIKTGMMNTFLQAVNAQQAWYKSAGTPDQISVMRVMTRNPDTKVYAFSESEALTSHVEPGDRAKGPTHDAGYDAFVALFKESSTIKTEYITCMAKM